MSNPPPPAGSPELQAMRGKLNALSAAIRLGHEAYEKSDLPDWAAHVVNNSVLMIPFYRSALVDLRGVAPRILAITGQPAVIANSEYARDVLTLVRTFPRLDKVLPVDADAIAAAGGGEEAEEALAGLRSELVYLVPFRSAGAKDAESPELIWLVEFDKPDARAIAPALLTLLREHYAESLFFISNRRRTPLVRRIADRRQWLRPSRLVLLLLLGFAVATVTVRVRQTVSADFEVVPAREHIAYAPFDGVIAGCRVKSGETVRAGDEIIRFETDEREFALNNARNDYRRTGAQLDLVRQQSFSDPAKRGQLKLLELQQEKAALEIARNQWYLDRGVLRAEAEGVLNAGDTDRMAGRAVRAGDMLFEVLETRNPAAEIMLDERNASVLEPDSQITLYLHTRPETPIPARVLSVTGKPLLTANRTYCYLIRADFSAADAGEVICGMRGIARIAGPRVTLGYYLFRHLVLWYRQL